jgi:hypothetical protein
MTLYPGMLSRPEGFGMLDYGVLVRRAIISYPHHQLLLHITSPAQPICQTEGVYEAMLVLFYGYGAKI